MCLCIYMWGGVYVCIYRRMSCMTPWSLLKLEVVHGALNRSDKKYLGDNLSLGFKVALMVCHCSGADSAQIMPGRNMETAFSRKGLCLCCNQKLSQTWGVSFRKECDCTKSYEDRAALVVLQDWLKLMVAAGKSVPRMHWLWPLNLTEKNNFCVFFLITQEGRLAKHVAEFNLSYCL